MAEPNDRTHGIRLVCGWQLSAALAAGLVSAVFPATAGHADEGGLEVSTDGIHFAVDFGATVFDDAGALVPGGELSAPLYIRNSSDHPASLSLRAVHLDAASAELAEALSVSATAAAGPASPVSFNTGQQCPTLMTDVTMMAGSTMKVALTIAMSGAVTGTTAQGESADLDLLVTLADPGAPPANGCQEGTVVSVLPSTGSGDAASAPDLPATGLVVAAPAAAAGMVVALGIYLLHTSGRRRKARS